MTYPYGGEDPLDGLDATPAERLAYLRALDEVDAEAAGGPGPDPEPGSWDGFNTATAQMDRARELDAQRLAEDVAEAIPDRRPPSAEVKLQRAMDRIERGTYTAAVPGPAARDAGGRFRQACGDPDDLGYCTERYHAPSCHVVTEGAAATGSAAEAEAWAGTLRGYTQPPGVLGYATELAGPSDPLGGSDTWAGLLAPPGGPDPGLHERMLAVLADAEAAEPGPEPREQLPPVGGLRAALGL